MNPKRKAELQRKLSMMPVPRPPAGLAERIKADIPADLGERGRQTPRAASPFALRIAASILLVLASTAFVTIYLVGSRSKTAFPSAPRTAAAPALAKPAALPEAEVMVTMAESRPAADELKKARKPSMVVAESKDQGGRATASRAERPAEKVERQQFAPSLVAANEVRRDEPERGTTGLAELGGAAPPAAPPPPPAPATSMADATRSEAVSVTAAAPAMQTAAAAASPIVPERAAKASPPATAEGEIRSARRGLVKTLMQPSPAAPHEMFGISIDPAALARVQRSIENGVRPAAANVDVEAIVSYLASPPGSPLSGVNFEVEASREPDVIGSRAAMIRFTIDTAASSSARTVGSDAKLEIEVDEVSVASFRLLGNSRPLTLHEPLLFDNSSVTGVIELTLNSGLAPLRKVATLKLKYRDAHGRGKIEQKIIRVNDLERSWEMASFRHRLSTLGAIWGESIKGGAAPAEVARTAQELATEAPRDTRARELADVANASSHLEGSGPSGPGLR